MSNKDLTALNEIQDRIYTLRGEHVMLDKDLADFYEVKPIRLREQVKRNIKRFPGDFMFQLTNEEVDFMVSQNAIPSRKHLGGTLPYVFTEPGVAAISAVLTTDRSVEVNIMIMRAFVAMRKFISNNGQLFSRLDSIEKRQIVFETNTDKRFDKIFEAIEERQIIPRKGIFFDGQVYDSHKFISDLIKSAKKSIVIIDNYIDDTVLNQLLKKKNNVSVLIYTKKISPQLVLDAERFNAQYPTLEIKELKENHDRFILIDDSIVYHIGASLKDLGKKWFAFSKFDTEGLSLIDRVRRER